MYPKEQAHILLVDDKVENLTALQAILTYEDCRLVLARSGAEALRKVLEYEFAVILMDADMPGLDGFETARLIRTRAKSQYTPIIFITATYKDEMNIAQGYAMGAVDYIFKPIVADIVRSKVKVFVDLFTKSVHAQALKEELKKRQQVETELKQLTYRMQTILAFAGEGICGLTIDGLLTFANPAAAAMLGMQTDELIDQPIYTLLSPCDMQKKYQSWQETPLYLALKNGYEIYTDEALFYKKKWR